MVSCVHNTATSTSQEARGASTPTPQDEKEIDDIVAAIEDDDVVSVSFEGFRSEDEDLDDPDSE